MSITLLKGGLADLVLTRGRLVPYKKDQHTINQERYLTESSNSKVTKYGSNSEFMEIQLKNIPESEYVLLIAWFESSQVDWSLNAFSLTDEKGISNSVRLWQNNFEGKAKANNAFDVKILLKVEL